MQDADVALCLARVVFLFAAIPIYSNQTGPTRANKGSRTLAHIGTGTALNLCPTLACAPGRVHHNGEFCNDASTRSPPSSALSQVGLAHARIPHRKYPTTYIILQARRASNPTVSPPATHSASPSLGPSSGSLHNRKETKKSRKLQKNPVRRHPAVSRHPHQVFSPHTQTKSNTLGSISRSRLPATHC